MKHFVKIQTGALKSQAPAYCKRCSKKVDYAKDYFLLDAHWKIKRKSDKLWFCSMKCLSSWSN